MAIKIEMLRCFAAVAKSGSLAAAAEVLGRTPSAVSMMLKQFEENIGSPLFETERKSKLTALGEFALDEAMRELDHFEHTVNNIQSFARSKSGLVRIASVPSVADTILPEAVQAFLRERPGVRIDIRDMDSAGVLRELERERVDIGLASGSNAGDGIECDELFSDALGIVCRHDHPLATAPQPLAWSVLQDWPFIANGLCAQITDSQFQMIYRASHLMVRNTTSLLAFVRSGAGITVLPQLVVSRSPDEIAFLRVFDPMARRRMHILRRSQISLSPSAQAFETTVRHVAAEFVSRFERLSGTVYCHKARSQQ